jgi:hypothetical protein
MDWYRLFNAVWQGVLIAIPVWIVYIAIKIQITEWLNKRRSTR